MRREGVRIQYYVSGASSFEEAVQGILRLTRETAEQRPGVPRELVVEIEGHRNSVGGYDRDMEELQLRFLFSWFIPYLTRVVTPLGPLVNPDKQREDLPDILVLGEVEGPGGVHQITGRGKSQF